jgi:hypothetical protein
VTLHEEFADHLRSVVGTGATVYTSKLPAKSGGNNQWSVVADGGTAPTGGNVLLWRQDVVLRVTHRRSSSKDVYDADAVLLTAVGTFLPVQSASVLSRVVTPITDTDQDAEGRQTASWQVTLTISIK